MFLIVITSLLTLTTPITLTDAMSTDGPATQNRVPAHEIAMMMTIALRHPTLMEKVRKLKAQMARGADFERGTFRRQKPCPAFGTSVCLFLQAADDLAVAMEARCYRGGEGRTRLRNCRQHRRLCRCRHIA